MCRRRSLRSGGTFCRRRHCRRCFNHRDTGNGQSKNHEDRRIFRIGRLRPAAFAHGTAPMRLAGGKVPAQYAGRADVHPGARQYGQSIFPLDDKTGVSFLTFTPQDSVVEPTMTPWIVFAFTFPEYRGHRYLGRLLDHDRKCAAANGAPFVFLLTPHIGLYEKYVFSYWGSAAASNTAGRYSPTGSVLTGSFPSGEKTTPRPA